jgi:trimethylamine--corrinoid protein Co-methyltransferase
MILSLEQLLIDVEMFRMARRARKGIEAGATEWFDDLLDEVRPGDHFIDRRSTAKAIRRGEWYVSKLGVHQSCEGWEAAGCPGLLMEARDRVEQILATHQPLPLEEEVRVELERIRRRAEKDEGFVS